MRRPDTALAMPVPVTLAPEDASPLANAGSPSAVTASTKAADGIDDLSLDAEHKIKPKQLFYRETMVFI